MNANQLEPEIASRINALGVEYEVLECDPDYADTVAFCEHYGYSLADSANCIVCASSPQPRKYAVCVLLADSRLDVNRVVRKRMQVKKASFASAEDTVSLTGMQIGGVMPLALPNELPLLIDARVMDRPKIILGGGGRTSKILIPPVVFEKIPDAQIIPDLAKLVE